MSGLQALAIIQVPTLVCRVRINADKRLLVRQASTLMGRRVFLTRVPVLQVLAPLVRLVNIGTELRVLIQTAILLSVALKLVALGQVQLARCRVLKIAPPANTGTVARVRATPLLLAHTSNHRYLPDRKNKFGIQ